MNIALHRYDHADPSVLRLLTHITKELKKLADKFDGFVEDLAAQRTVVDGVVALLLRLDEQLAEAQDDPEQIAVIRAGFAEQRQRLADAIANVPPVPVAVPKSNK